MLKTQLRSKLFQLASDWVAREDILTGDFFGVLDYLPRQPYLHGFLKAVNDSNEGAVQVELDRLHWGRVEMLFWPRAHVNNNVTEPDVVLCSDRWVIVVEVKLESGLGRDQPWREYLVGQQIAQERNLCPSNVYYLVVSRDRISASQVFDGLQAGQRARLESHTLFFRWSQITALVETWLRYGPEGEGVWNGAARMLNDLRAVLRRRRTLAFLGFSFPYQQTVQAHEQGLFCPSKFSGFLADDAIRCSPSSSAVFLSRFRGFVRGTQTPPITPGGLLRVCRFRGFLFSTELTGVSPETIFCPSTFWGFLDRVLRCSARATMPAFSVKERINR